MMARNAWPVAAHRAC